MKMVRALEQEQESYRSRLFHFRGMHNTPGCHTKSLSVDQAGATTDYLVDDTIISRSQGSTPLHEHASSDTQQSGWSLHRSNNDKVLKSRLAKEEMKEKQPSGKFFSFILPVLVSFTRMEF